MYSGRACQQFTPEPPYQSQGVGQNASRYGSVRIRTNGMPIPEVLYHGLVVASSSGAVYPGAPSRRHRDMPLVTPAGRSVDRTECAGRNDFCRCGWWGVFGELSFCNVLRGHAGACLKDYAELFRQVAHHSSHTYCRTQRKRANTLQGTSSKTAHRKNDRHVE